MDEALAEFWLKGAQGGRVEGCNREHSQQPSTLPQAGLFGVPQEPAWGPDFLSVKRASAPQHFTRMKKCRLLPDHQFLCIKRNISLS